MFSECKAGNAGWCFLNCVSEFSEEQNITSLLNCEVIQDHRLYLHYVWVDGAALVSIRINMPLCRVND